MTNLDSKGGLAIAELVFFSPALVISAYIVFRHGFARQLGWIYLVILSILRLIGSSCTIYMQVHNDYSAGLEETAAITASVGTAPLIMAMLGFLNRVNDGMRAAGVNLSDRIFRITQLLITVALILAIVGGVDRSPGKSASTVKTGNDLTKAASIMFLILFVATVGIAVITFTRKSAALVEEHKLILAAIIAIPFLAVRVIYTVIVSTTTSPSSIFYWQDVSVYVAAFMQFMMEALVVVIFIATGLATPKKVAVAPAGYEGEVELEGQQQGRTMRGQNGYGPRKETRPMRAPRNIGDYRPSKLIRNAISGR